MSAAAVAAGAMAVESQNVVGVTSGTTGNNFNFLTVPLNAVGYNTADIQQIKISDGDAGNIGWGEELFEIWEGAPDVVAGSGFIYWDSSMDPAGEETGFYWGDDACAKASYSIVPGQAVVINCAADLDVSIPGQVPSASNVEFSSVYGFNFTGNPFPEEIDIQAIAISDGDAGNIGWGEELFEIWEGAPDVVAGSGFIYWDSSMDPAGEETGFYWGDDACAKVVYPIAAGQGVVINCAADLDVSIAPPYNSL